MRAPLPLSVGRKGRKGFNWIEGKLQRVIAGNLEDLGPITDQKAILEQIETDKIGTQRRIASNIDALEGFESMLDEVTLYGADAELGANAPQKLTRYGVEISVRPEIVLRKAGKAGQLVGAVKLHFPRLFSLDENAAGVVSTVVQEWCKQIMPDDGITAGELCFVIDIGSRRAFPGAKSTANRLKQIDAACQNIAGMWAGI